MLLAFTLQVGQLLPMILNLLEECLAWLGPVLHREIFVLMAEQMPDRPSIVSKARIYPMPLITLNGKPTKEKSPAGDLPAGL